jgi:hypothetical protein
MAKVFGILSSSGLNVTGAVVEGGEITYTRGDSRKLTGNPCSTIADERVGSADHYVMNVSFEFESITTTPPDLLNTEATGTVTSEDTVSASLTGKVTKWVTAFEKENWWKATLTIEADKEAV